MKVIPKHNDGRGFTKGYKYDVYAIILEENQSSYILIDDYDTRVWMDSNLFVVTDGSIPSDWLFDFCIVNEARIAILGYKEWFTDPNYANDLYELREAALAPLRREKELNTAIIDQFDIVEARTDVPYAFIPSGTYGTVTGRPDKERDMMEVTFHKDDGRDYPPVTVPRLFLKLNTKT